jgi:hypothetical protein
LNYQQALINSIFSPQNTSNTESSKEPHNAGSISDGAQAALGVYHNNYIENGIRALSISFATVAGLLDDSDFRRLAHDYLLAYPKQCYDWADYGESFAEFMYDIDALAAMPFLPEVAELDWRLMHIERAQDQSFDAASFARLQSEDSANLSFVPSATLQIMPAVFPLSELYALVHSDAYSEGPAAENVAHSIEARKRLLSNINKLVGLAIKTGEYRSIVLYRKDYKGIFDYVDGNALEAFKCLLSQNTVESVLSKFGDDQAAMTAWLQQQIEKQNIIAVHDFKCP